MGEQTFLERLREWIGNIGYKVFLWSNGWTDEQFIQKVREQP
jgi:hypothetical protein